VSRDGVRRERLRREGVSREGVSREGVSSEGVRREGVRREGVSREEVSSEGVSTEGVSPEGVSTEGGTFCCLESKSHLFRSLSFQLGDLTYNKGRMRAGCWVCALSYSFIMCFAGGICFCVRFLVKWKTPHTSPQKKHKQA
jgi:hypothetical protein